MMVDQRQRKRKWSDDLFSYHNPFESFALVEHKRTHETIVQAIVFDLDLLWVPIAITFVKPDHCVSFRVWRLWLSSVVILIWLMESRKMMGTKGSNGATCDGSPKFGVSLTTIGDLHKLINDIEAGKHDELLFEMTNDDRMETIDALGTICNSIQADNINADGPLSVDINTKSTSYAGAAGASAKDQPKVNFNFHTLVADPVFDGVNISIPHKIVKKDHDEFQRLFFFKFDSRAGLEAVLEGEDDISLIATFIGKPVMLDSYTSTMCNELWGRSSFAHCLIEVNSEGDLVDVVTIDIPSLYGDGFTKETIRVDDGFQTVGKKRRGKTNGKSSKKDNLSMSTSFSALNDEEDDDEEDVENMYDESANLIQNTKAGGSSYFTAAAG
uniref:Zinc knuckle CX2CX4HX4C n=1 Tax=Tanacetum cinerariifolium TaxID=118510 RepID=A0A6L2NPL7_TANCI|nr:zinc knuckle CX2CX4HX4C [Tanacetum cinerariifolium]